MWTKLLAPAFLATLGLASPAYALTLDTQGGELVGATGVDVGGTLYDVVFGDGTCAGLFDGCDDVGDFDFQSEAAARAAADALFAHVLVDQGTAATNYDTVPGLTRGCGGFGGCQLFVPYGLSGTDVLIAFADNNFVEAADQVLLVTDTALSSTSGGPATYASFSLAASATIPLPAPALLLGGALAAIGGLARRRKG